MSKVQSFPWIIVGMGSWKIVVRARGRRGSGRVSIGQEDADSQESAGQVEDAEWPEGREV